MQDGERQGRGAFYTPAEVAGSLVAVTVERGPVVDPACGAGVFLLAAGIRLAAQGADPRLVATTQLFGADIDPVAVDLTRCALAGWAGIDPGEVVGVVEADSLLTGRSTWPTAPGDGFGAVVGNPPFLGQLRSGTAFDADRRQALRDRFPGMVGAYTDAAWLFLALGMDLLAPGGRMSLIQPQSLLTARDAAAIRGRLLERGRLDAFWFDRSGVFAGRTGVCAPVVERVPPDGSEVGLLVDRTLEPAGSAAAPTGTDGWGGLVAALLGIPVVSPRTEGRVGDLARVTAGFRQHYYGLVDAVGEEADVAGGRPLVTTGLVDPLHCRWGTSSARFAGRRWSAPVVDPAAVADEVADWIAARNRPKLLVATQTRVVEAMVDPEGSAVPLTPLITVEPDPSDLWHLAAVLASPPISAIAAVSAAGAGRSLGRIRLTARQVAALPLPGDRSRWDEGAEAARVIHEADGAVPAGRWLAFGEAMCGAYGVSTTPLLDWWWAAHPASRSVIT